MSPVSYRMWPSARRPAVMQAAGFSVWHFKSGRLIAVDTVNAAKDHLLARKLLDAGRLPTPAQVADAGFDLAGLLAA